MLKKIMNTKVFNIPKNLLSLAKSLCDYHMRHLAVFVLISFFMVYGILSPVLDSMRPKPQKSEEATEVALTLKEPPKKETKPIEKKVVVKLPAIKAPPKNDPKPEKKVQTTLPKVASKKETVKPKPKRTLAQRKIKKPSIDERTSIIRGKQLAKKGVMPAINIDVDSIDEYMAFIAHRGSRFFLKDVRGSVVCMYDPISKKAIEFKKDQFAGCTQQNPRSLGKYHDNEWITEIINKTIMQLPDFKHGFGAELVCLWSNNLNYQIIYAVDTAAKSAGVSIEMVDWARGKFSNGQIVIKTLGLKGNGKRSVNVIVTS